MLPEEAWARLSTVGRIHVAKGTKLNLWQPGKDDKAEILRDVIGPSGKLRAPAFQVGNEMVVGFHAETYAALLG